MDFKHIIQLFLITTKIILIILLILIKLNIIINRPLHILIELLFMVLLCFYVIYITNPFRKKKIVIDEHDNILLFAMAILFLLTINYKNYISEIKNLFVNLYEEE
eukprot:GHVU01042789.1.p1 GENE.GHVU01042789.1~~GHVU01042789.1.p1  ORF type:complete len:105 (+),score=13.54 GHVU01042789.1:3-317(+)